ncbi:uncharacterized protein Triagg1_10615 [Trichoderma aggressivum f. europaeum]|uniref:3-beta hydroxysteroid dehydrogenase/isomerase domain-containing protein n=1 Tax=Trichoderma aggressivum f. europaeum TaxID=173218 RepID=A0AAE1IZV7_9HYPO|nr:hypothetical protein Triagg1_10615 [Trichoderma aggressivum f. europaeum]
MSIQATLPKGSLVLVTGAFGYIRAHVTKQLLHQSANSSPEVVILNNINDKNQIQQAIQGVAGLVYIAAPNTFSPDPNETPRLRKKSVKEFVYTSTIGAATMLPAQPGFHSDGTNWNESARALDWAPPPYTPDPSMIAYIYAIFVDVRDVALLHVAALLDPSLEVAHVPAWGYEFNWIYILKILTQLNPGTALPVALDNPEGFNGTADVAQVKHALKQWSGQDGFVSLEKGVIIL